MQPFDTNTEYDEGELQVGILHTMHYSQSGNPDGLPVVYLHGGPGSLSKPEKHRRFFDPKKYRVILYDQRGCGQSHPSGEILENSTNLLVEDLERLRQHLQIDRWVIMGNSWGTTLGLAYAEKYPQYVAHLILRGVFLGRAEDIAWVDQGEGLRRIFPELWRERQRALGDLGVSLDSTKTVATQLFSLFEKGELEIRRKIVCAVSNWEDQFGSIYPQTFQLNPADETNDHLLDGIRIMLHYFANNCFLRENQLLEEADHLVSVPVSIIHGRYDMVCPFDQAFLLADRIGHAKLYCIKIAGHDSQDPGMTEQVIAVVEKLPNYF